MVHIEAYGTGELICRTIGHILIRVSHVQSLRVGGFSISYSSIFVVDPYTSSSLSLAMFRKAIWILRSSLDKSHFLKSIIYALSSFHLLNNGLTFSANLTRS
jgi:hypothetical protein